MAVHYFLEIDGIPGESKDAKHKDELDVETWSWGETAIAPPSGRGGGGAGKVDMQAFELTVGMSKASPPLMLACASGKHIKNAVLTARRGGKAQSDFLKIQLEEVVVSSYQTAGGDGDENGPLDSISLVFSKIRMEYRETRPDGSLGASVEFGWDVRKNVAL